MAFGVAGTIVGLQETVAALKGLPGKVQRKILRPAMNKGTKPIVAAARKNAPVETALLKKSIYRKTVTYKSGTLVSIIGPRRGLRQEVTRRGRKKPAWADPANYGHLVELGVRPHSLQKGDKLARTSEHAKAAEARRAANLARWHGQLAKAKTPAARAAIEKKIARATRIAAVNREEKQSPQAKMHPGIKPTRFLERAFAQSRDACKKIFADEIARGLAKLAAAPRKT